MSMPLHKSGRLDKKAIVVAAAVSATAAAAMAASIAVEVTEKRAIV